MPATARAETASIYANGSTGDDDNPGTQESPVKTFAKAKERLQETPGASVISVTGRLVVSGDTSETWSLGEGQTLKRDVGYQGELIRVAGGAALTLENIVIDGSSTEGVTAVASGGNGEGGSLVGVYNNSTLTIGEGAALQNNHIESRGNWYPEAGGAVFATMSSTVNVEGGTITGNEAVWGGGIYGIHQATINMSSGTIGNNKAIKDINHSARGGYGGGICVYEGSEINLSGGTITHNFAFEDGGGIAVGTSEASNEGQPILTMRGGTITENSAGSCGGGIFVQAGFIENSGYNSGAVTYGIARITAGYVTNNSTTHTGEGNDAFGGGGIYVNGYNLAGLNNGELYLTNVKISGNDATLQGGGYAACPSTVTEIRLTNGAAFYDNTTSGENARELYILASAAYGAHSGNPPYEISPSMLGGGANKWVYDDGTEVPLNELKGVLNADAGETLSLSNDLSANDPGIQETLDKATVHITNNTSATRGGGIGSNGSVFIGTAVGTTEVSVSKIWDDADDVDGIRPDSVEVELYRDDTYVGYQTVEPDNTGTWSTTFANLPKENADGVTYDYTVEEREVAGYTSSVAGNAETGFTITNTPNPETSISVTKSWVGETGEAVTIHLLADGTVTGEPLPLSEADGWQGSFDGVPTRASDDGHEIVYTVSEDALDGYTSEIAGDAETGFTVTNTHIPEEPEPSTTPDDSDTPEDDGETGETDSDTTLPQTGDSDSPVEILSLISVSLLVAGAALSIARRRAAQ